MQPDSPGQDLNDYPFPERLADEDAKEMIKKLKLGLNGLPDRDGCDYEYVALDEASDLERRALKERRLLNDTLEKKKGPSGMIVSEDESVSLVLNGDDHIRMQFIAPGMCLRELWDAADQMDDYINERFAYAFDEKYGYLTAYPTNVGTGLRASILIHLPTLSMGKKFNSLLGEMGRFGTRIQGICGEGSENYGALFVISNQKTLGVSEEEIVELVGKVAVQLNSQENKVRAMALSAHKTERADEAYKSYGVLKYARRLSWKDAQEFLSSVMTGMADGLLEVREPLSVYKIMLGIQTANLQKISDRPLTKEELDIARAAYIREALPELK
ncbi:ATP--guanido phosphotransferase [Clostridium sp. AM58-1XD]|uniref:ATP--guanido phosphotransferase n=1 Tax=Clostridium sp. AM58-1XD TaxID=2292307 RepID=UPI002682EA9B